MPHDQRRVLDVVEDDDGLWQHEAQVGKPQLVRVRIGQPLDVAHPVVADHADGPADEARPLAPLRRHVVQAAQLVTQERKRITRGGHALLEPLAVDPLSPGHLLASGAERCAGASAQEAVSGPLLAALDRLEQEARATVVETPEERQRRVEVRENLARDGNQVAALRQGLELFEGRAEHPSQPMGLSFALFFVFAPCWPRLCIVAGRHRSGRKERGKAEKVE